MATARKKNKVDVLLISPHLDGPGVYTKSLATALPLGLLRLCAALEARGIAAAVLNATPFRRWATVQSLVASSLESLCTGGVVGVSANVSLLRGGAFRILRLVRTLRGNASVGLGGIHATHLYKSLLEFMPVDFIARGECEQIFPEYVMTREAGARVPGIVTSVSASEADVRPGVVGRLDALPIPDYGKVNLKLQLELYARPADAYRPGNMMLEDGLVIESSRGCPYACAFCGVASRPWRAHSAAYVSTWVSELHERHGFNSFTFVDDFFTKSRRRIIELCGSLGQMKTPVIWAAQTRADMTDPEMMRAMKAAGCRLIAYGVESGAPDVRNRINKNLAPDSVRDAVASARAAGVRSQIFFLVGNPGETGNDMRASIRLIESVSPDFICVDSLKIFPGTLLYDEMKKSGGITDDYWLDGGSPVPEYSAKSEAELNRLKMRIEYAWRRSAGRPLPRGMAERLGPDFRAGGKIGGVAIRELFAGRPGSLHLVVSIGKSAVCRLFLEYSLTGGDLSFRIFPDPFAGGARGGNKNEKPIKIIEKYLESRALMLRTDS